MTSHKNCFLYSSARAALSVFMLCACFSIGANEPASQEVAIELNTHDQWWGKHFTNPEWLGGVQMESRAMMRRQLIKKRYKSVLDIPCAYCVDYQGLKDHGISVEYLGMDITRNMIDDCRSRGINVQLGSIENIPLNDSSFDLVYARHILEHLSYYEKSIASMIRVAAKEVFIVFFQKPHDAPDHIESALFQGDPLFHNIYNRKDTERFIMTHDKVDRIEWETVDSVEEILHIYLKNGNVEPDLIKSKCGESADVACAYTQPVDFDISLGKNERLTVGDKTYSLFDDFQRSQPEFSGAWDLASKPRPVMELYVFLKNLYEKNNPWHVKPANRYLIPPHIHQIWIQGELPPQYREWQKTWQKMFPGWQYTLWTDKEIRKLPLRNRRLYEEETNYGAMADVARYEILYMFGGIYLDADFECLRPDMFDLFNRCYSFYSGMVPLDCSHFELGSGIIASAPGHPVLKDVIDTMGQSYNPSLPVHLREGGPAAFTRAFWRSADKPGYVDIAFPPSFFYPVGMYTVVGGSYTSPAHYQHLLKPESVALHYWGRSWSGSPRY